MIFRLKYIKGEEVKYISHLDLLRAFSRAIRRAAIPVAYSQGFNPHMKLSFGPALALGATSQGEYLDIDVLQNIPTDDIINKLNEKLGPGLRIIKGKQLNDNPPSIEGQVLTGMYKLTINTIVKSKELLDSFLNRSEIVIDRERKGKSKEINIKPFIKHINFNNLEDNLSELEVLIATGSKGNLKPDELIKAMKNWGVFLHSDIIMDIHRIDMFIDELGEDTPLDI